MKRYEMYNKHESKKRSAQDQAVGMLVAKIVEDINADNEEIFDYLPGHIEDLTIRNGDIYKNLFNHYLEWLNKECE